MRILLIAGLSASLSGCWFAVVGGGGAEAGYTAGQKDRSAGQTIDDQVIFTKIKSELLTASGVPSGRVDVTVRLGVVTLKGALDTSEQKSKVLSVVRGVKGVKKVVDKLVVEK